MVAVGLLATAGALFACKALPGCPLYAAPPDAKFVSKPLSGEKKMPTTQQTRQIEHASEATFRDVVLKSDVPVLVDFYADWCGPCQRLTPVLEQLAAETPNAKIVKVNVDHSPRLAVQYGVESIPSLKLFEKGAVTDEVVGLASKRQLQEMLNR